MNRRDFLFIAGTAPIVGLVPSLLHADDPPPAHKVAPKVNCAMSAFCGYAVENNSKNVGYFQMSRGAHIILNVRVPPGGLDRLYLEPHNWLILPDDDIVTAWSDVSWTTMHWSEGLSHYVRSSTHFAPIPLLRPT